MTFKRMLWAREQCAGGPAQKLVLILIADSAGAGSCDVVMTERWAQIAELPEPTVWEICLQLADAGLITMGDGQLAPAHPA